MNIDKRFLMELIKHNKKEYEYLFNLYKVYELSRKITNGHLKRNRDLLDEIEDKIYTINGKVLSDQDRIALEVKRVYKSFENIKNQRVKTQFIDELKSIVGNLNFNFDDKDYSDDSIVDQEQLYSVAKRRLSILQAKLNLPISFMYDASMAFIDLYECEYVNAEEYFADIMKYVESREEINYKYDLTKENNIIYDFEQKKNGGK